jgi:hypothetical protein
MRPDHEYEARHIYEASHLYALGVVLISVIPGGSRAATFLFENKDGHAEQTAREYREYAAAPVKAAFEALGALKAEADRARGRTERVT